VEDNKNVLMLYDAIKEHVEYLFGDRITALDEQPDGVLVAFASGAQKKFDLVIGADGPHSGVRALAFGPESEFLHHLGVYMTFWTVRTDPGLDKWALGYTEPGRTAGLRSIHDNRQAMSFFGFTSDARPDRAARHRRPGRARASRSSARTCSRASWPRRTATTRRAWRGTSRRCAGSSR
jgi:2-polyprenyl-6-methoxyphenol hydroxylase-like FAD-dependent oxidoreductase